jgi:hypothetical protein
MNCFEILRRTEDIGVQLKKVRKRGLGNATNLPAECIIIATESRSAAIPVPSMIGAVGTCSITYSNN